MSVITDYTALRSPQPSRINVGYVWKGRMIHLMERSPSGVWRPVCGYSGAHGHHQDCVLLKEQYQLLSSVACPDCRATQTYATTLVAATLALARQQLVDTSAERALDAIAQVLDERRVATALNLNRKAS